MTAECTYQPARTDDLAVVADLFAQSYHGCSKEDYRKRLEAYGPDHVRVIRRAGQTIATGQLVQVGQFFGGKSVPSWGVAGVAVRPDVRGEGVATFLMEQLLAEMRAEGIATSSLYPATTPLYRKSGYERAGLQIQHSLKTAPVRARCRDGQIVPVTDDLCDEMKDVYRRYAIGRNGMMDRSDVWWSHVLDEHGPEPPHGYLLRFDGQSEGYVLIRRNEKYLDLADYAALTPRAAERILTMISHQGMRFTEARFYGGLNEPLEQTAGNQVTERRFTNDWMMRIVHLPEALAARGYNRAVSASVEVEIADELFSDNAGRWTVNIDDGEAHVQQGGSGAVKMNIRTLASLYSGFLTADLAARTQQLSGPAEQIATLAAALAGPYPYMSDSF
ncbi:MAG: enhanced intracellular survival protein Eis [Phycisphaerae bacterium]